MIKSTKTSLYTSMTGIRSCFLVSLVFLLTTNILGQQVRECININNVHTTAMLRVANGFVQESAVRSRTFNYNPQLRLLTAANKGDTLLLDFFDNRQYKAIISNVTIGYDDVLGITARIVDNDFASCIISISNAGISLRTDIPVNDEHYRAAIINRQPVLSQYSLSAISKSNFTPEPVILPSVEVAGQIAFPQTRATDDIEEHVTIDVLVAYSTKAKDWAEKNATSIDNAINMAFQYANHVLENSKIRIMFNLIYKYETDYPESQDANMDLAVFQHNGDGILDEVHNLRKQYGADLAVLMPMTGSYAYLPDYDLNKPNPSFGFSVCNVGSSTYSATLVHELGHNLGAHHHWQQLRTRFPGPGIFAYSSAWRGVGEDGKWYHTVMSYSGDSFTDKNPSTLIPYFSNPDVMVHGVLIGSKAKENNALTLEQTKHVIASYSVLIGAKNPSTDKEGLEIPALKAYTTNGNLHVSGLKSGEPLRIYNLTGQLIYKGIAKTSEEVIPPLATSGFYVIVTGNRSIKVLNSD